jgi:hypothetical protein
MMVRRFDQEHRDSRKPHIVLIPEQELQRMLADLESSEFTPRLFVRNLTPFPQVLSHIMRAANAPGNGTIRRIDEPTKALSWLGSRKLSEVLERLPEELIERDG